MRQHLGAGTDTVVEQTLIRAPVTEHEAVAGHAVQEDILDVPDVLPFGDFISRVEATPDSGEVDADRQCDVSEQVAAAIGVVLTGVLGVDRERGLAGKHEPADIGRLLIALGLGKSARLEEIAQQEPRRIGQTTAAAVLEQPVDAERPARERLDRKLSSKQPRILPRLSTPL